MRFVLVSLLLPLRSVETTVGGEEGRDSAAAADACRAVLGRTRDGYLSDSVVSPFLSVSLHTRTASVLALQKNFLHVLQRKKRQKDALNLYILAAIAAPISRDNFRGRGFLGSRSVI